MKTHAPTAILVKMQQRTLRSQCRHVIKLRAYKMALVGRPATTAESGGDPGSPPVKYRQEVTPKMERFFFSRPGL